LERAKETAMPRLAVFNNVTLDGFFSGTNGEFQWAKGHMDAEFQAFIEENARPGGVLVFGRKTYDLMRSYWPTPMALQNDPVVAEQMNALSKIVISRTMDEATWNNTRLVKGDLITEMRKLKADSGGRDMTILGSGSIVSQLADAGLIDEFQVVVNPVVLGAGRTMFQTVKKPLELKCTNTRTFRNGNVWVCYEPAA